MSVALTLIFGRLLIGQTDFEAAARFSIVLGNRDKIHSEAQLVAL